MSLGICDPVLKAEVPSFKKAFIASNIVLPQPKARPQIMERRDDRRRREDTRDPRPRYQERDQRSRSPPHREQRRDERRRDRSPFRAAPRGPSHRSDRDRNYQRGSEQLSSGPRPLSSGRLAGERPPPRQPLDSRPNGAAPKGKPESAPASASDARMEDGLADEDEETAMQRVMGFKGFRSTKNTKVPGNDKNYGVNKVKKAEYRQYMNRVGGFNRPLSPSRA